MYVPVDGSDLTRVHGYDHSAVNLDAGKVMTSEANLTASQTVLRAMNSTQSVISKLRDLLTESQKKGVITPEVYDQLHDEVLSAGLSIEKEKIRIKELAETDPEHAELDEGFFEVTPEELKNFKVRSAEGDQSAA